MKRRKPDDNRWGTEERRENSDKSLRIHTYKSLEKTEILCYIKVAHPSSIWSNKKHFRIVANIDIISHDKVRSHEVKAFEVSFSSMCIQKLKVLSNFILPSTSRIVIKSDPTDICTFAAVSSVVHSIQWLYV